MKLVRMWGTWAIALAMIIVIAPVVGVGQITAAQAAVTGGIPDQTWGVTGEGPATATDIPAQVFDIAQIGNTVYVGGKFTEVVERTDKPGFSQAYIAAFDATTGVWIDWWTPTFNAPVYELEASPDGSRLYVGGEFTEVNGVPSVKGIVALDPATGAIDPSFATHLENSSGSTVPGTVHAITATNDWVYIGGSFNKVWGNDPTNQKYVWKITRVDPTTGAPDTTWRPQLREGVVHDIEVDAARDRVYVSGTFKTVYNEPWGAFVPLDEDDASILDTLNQPHILTPTQNQQWEMVQAGGKLWLAGTQHVIQMLNPDTLEIERRWGSGFHTGFHTGGDFQAIEVSADGQTIYATCHCKGVIFEVPNDVTATADFWDLPIDDDIKIIAAWDASTGDYKPEFQPDISGSAGGWAIHGAPDGCVWLGGDVNRDAVGDVYSNGVVRWCDDAGQGPPVAPSLTEPPADTEAPTAPTSVDVKLKGSGEAEVWWGPATDNMGVTHYEVYRNGALEAITHKSEFWSPPPALATDRWSVKAVDDAGNTSIMSADVGISGSAIDAMAPANGSTVLDVQTLTADPYVALWHTSGLTVRFSIDGSTKTIATWNQVNQTYELAWDTTTVANGAHEVCVFVNQISPTVAALCHSVTVDNPPPPASGYEATVLADNPASYWRLSEATGTSAADAAGLVNGTFVGTPELGTPGLILDPNTSVRFSGDDRVTVPNNAAHNVGGPYEEKTVELWFNADSASSRRIIYEQGSTSRGISMYTHGGNLYAGVWNRVNDGDGTTPWSGDAFLSTPINAAQTYHAVLVYDFPSDSVELYLDGVLVDSATGVGRLFSHSGGIGIGAMNVGTRFHDKSDGGAVRYYFQGTIDEVAVYNSALTAAQVAEHFADGS